MCLLSFLDMWCWHNISQPAVSPECQQHAVRGDGVDGEREGICCRWERENKRVAQRQSVRRSPYPVCRIRCYTRYGIGDYGVRRRSLPDIEVIACKGIGIRRCCEELVICRSKESGNRARF